MITNDAQLKAVLMPIIQDSIREVCQISLWELKNIIKDTVYGRPASLWYERTMQFDRQWEVKEKAMTNTMAQVMIDHIPELLSRVPEKHQHSQWGANIGENLADAVFQGYEVFNTGYFVEARPAWEIWKNTKMRDGDIDRRFRGAMRRRGLPITKG